MAAKKKTTSKKAGTRKKSTSASGKYVKQEMHERKHGKRESREQAIAIGLSKARRSGEDVPPPKKGKTSAATRKKAESDYKAGHKKRASKKTAAKKATAKKSSAKKTSAKKTARKSTTKKRAAKKTAAKRRR
jgi:hypothetical protein